MVCLFRTPFTKHRQSQMYIVATKTQSRWSPSRPSISTPSTTHVLPITTSPSSKYRNPVPPHHEAHHEITTLMETSFSWTLPSCTEITYSPCVCPRPTTSLSLTPETSGSPDGEPPEVPLPENPLISLLFSFQKTEPFLANLNRLTYPSWTLRLARRNTPERSSRT